MSVTNTISKYVAISVSLVVSAYLCLLIALTTKFFQSHVVYLHSIQMTWFKDLNVPEVFGFLHNQVTPFWLKTADGQKLYTWHILPLELYRKHEKHLISESSGIVLDFTERLAFRLLQNDPEARLVLHFHGAGGTVGSGYRTPSYRALSAGKPDKIHVLTFDYRGFGRSSGSPSENGIFLDALTVVEWATNVAKIPPERILIFGQSLGTAVSIAVLEHFATQSPPVNFAGAVLVAPFVDVPTLVATYRVAGTIPIISPLARFPVLFTFLSTFIRDKWLSKDRIAQFIRSNEANGAKYRLTLIHAEDDYDIPWYHTHKLFWHSVNATLQKSISFDEMEKEKEKIRVDMGAAGTNIEWRTQNGVIREEILKYGLHDVVMGYPIVTLAVMRIIEPLEENGEILK